MHELSLTSRIVEVVTDKAAGRRIAQVRLRIGTLAGVEIEAIRFCFDACALGTTAEGASLEIDVVAGQGQCPTCGHLTALDQLIDLCDCGTQAPLRVIAGEELSIVDIQVEDG
jgi:hydrogenase nickel incorporation protein HypA/HybF